VKTVSSKVVRDLLA